MRPRPERLRRGTPGIDRENATPLEDAPYDARLSPAVAGILAAHGIRTLEQLVSLTPTELLSLRDFGPASLCAVEDHLSWLGFALRPDPREPANPDAGRIPAVQPPTHPLTRPPTTHSPDNLVALVCASPTARERLATFASGLDVSEPDLQLSLAIEDKLRQHIGRRTLHPEALLDWYPIERFANTLSPPPRDIRAVLYAARLLDDRAGGIGSLYVLSAALDSDLAADLEALAGPGVLDVRQRDILNLRYAPRGRRKLATIADKHTLSPERVRQIELGASHKVSQAFEVNPLPYFRSALLYAGDLLPLLGSTRKKDPVAAADLRRLHDHLSRTPLGSLDPTIVHTMLTLWHAIIAHNARVAPSPATNVPPIRDQPKHLRRRLPRLFA